MDAEHWAALEEFLPKTQRPPMILARNRRTGEAEWFRTELDTADDGRKKKYRAWVRENLVCFLEFCEVSLTAHFRTDKISGFVHRSEVQGEHAPESVWHQRAKRMIAAWAETLTEVQVDVELASRDRTRRPDVTITMPDGAESAIEVQYSSMTVADYAARDRDHSKQYAASVWLLGHTRPNFAVDDNRRIRVNELIRAIAERSNRLPLWINPEKGLVLTAWSSEDHFGPRPFEGHVASKWEVVPLTACRLHPRLGIVTPAQHRATEAQRRREEERRERARLRAARKQQEEQAAAQRQLKNERDWDSSVAKAWLTTLHHDALPDALQRSTDDEHKLAEVLSILPIHWKTLVYREIVTSNRWLAWKDICRVVRKLQERDDAAGEPDWDTLKTYTSRLEDGRLVARRLIDGWKIEAGPTSLEDAPPAPESVTPPASAQVLAPVRQEAAPPEPAPAVQKPASSTSAQEPLPSTSQRTATRTISAPAGPPVTTRPPTVGRVAPRRTRLGQFLRRLLGRSV